MKDTIVKSHKCHRCPKAFKTSTGLKRHLTMSHKEGRKNKIVNYCPQCGCNINEWK